MKKRKTILITAYAVNPYKGSEDGTGWNISRELAKEYKVHIVTRKNNQPEIDRFLQENDDQVHQNMHFYYYDLPKWIMYWKYKMGERGYVLYFYLWQLCLPLFVKIHRIKFDFSHAINFHSDSHPQFLWLLGKPVFWGPIGHHPPVPKAYLRPVYGRGNWVKDRLYNSVKFIMRNFDPFYYISKWTAKRIFVINSGINKSVGANPNKIIVLPAVANDFIPENINRSIKKEFTVLAVGRFVYMKGFDITIRAFSKFYHQLTAQQQKNVKLKLVGKGIELERMKLLITSEKIGDAVEIIKWVEKAEMDAIYKDASVFCFGSHEGAGMVIPEALSYGLPVICFDNYGPGELCDETCAIKIPYSKYQQSTTEFADALISLYASPKLYSTYTKGAREYASKHFYWAVKANVISKAYALLG